MAALKPFVKWAGGKRQILPEIHKYLPPDIEGRTYYEPFIGGGALLFDLMPKKAIINDINSELMLSYTVIRDNAEDLISILKEHQRQYNADYYYNIRGQTNLQNNIEKAGRFIFLNKTCYNGLYRVNSQGFFNVPAGKHKTLNICEEQLLRSVSAYLMSAEIKITNTDFAEAVAGADKNSFVYFDPPYHSLKKTGFSAYQAGGFGEAEQIRLRDLFVRLTAQGIPCLLSNADTPFIREIYGQKDIHLVSVKSRRFINSDKGGRGSVYELLIMNYDCGHENNLGQDNFGHDKTDQMNITYKQFEPENLSAVMELQNEWFFENITCGVVPDAADEILRFPKEFFFIAADNKKVIGYAASEVIKDNKYNVFPKGAEYLSVNDLYISKDYRSKGIGANLLSMTEEKAREYGLQDIFISSATKDAAAVREFYQRNGYGVWTTLFYKRNEWDTRTYPLGELDGYRFVVIFARYMDKWLYCRARERNVYETPGGHIEKDETPLEAAKRELFEETGAAEYEIKPAFDYSVHTPEEFSNGQVFLANIQKLGAMPDYEMAEVKLFDTIPEKMRFPQILPVLFKKILDFSD
ncbi:MAG: Dam family site-specific DNA-(adenine-N6)-methyltransferase [Treponema sp.]|nr:Dam family site-specific DNA-(adenine-N6)-methyltransferase [Treponema sp.]